MNLYAKVLSYYLIIVWLAFIGKTSFSVGSASWSSAKCRSRCISQITVQCDNNSHCLACLQPCEEKKLSKVLSCSRFCSVNFMKSTKLEKVCRDSCKFLKHLNLKDLNSSCPLEVPRNQCVLMRPESVQVSIRRHAYIVSWNGTWPPGTVFIVMSRQTEKASLSNSTPADAWTEIKQTTSHSVQVDVQPSAKQQFKVAAVNQYSNSSFSIPSKSVFIKPQNPGPPRDLRVSNMRRVKNHVYVDVSWRKPAEGKLKVVVEKKRKEPIKKVTGKVKGNTLWKKTKESQLATTAITKETRSTVSRNISDLAQEDSSVSKLEDSKSHAKNIRVSTVLINVCTCVFLCFAVLF
ncbi:anosmin-1-like isoform X3 [Montipora capricornis]|uniref:anosmin-1-like isoform X3 n=1 Tax=Montipora capricornis TaxID=246305 RepID=UPI0035F13776